jgi:xylan 1,4-beta-xylosidase
MPTFTCDLNAPATPFPHYWEHTVGSAHALLALRADWQAQLQRCHEELGFRHVRFHGILCDDVGTLVDERDRPIYSFLNADRIVDFLLEIGMKPFVELSFMPTTLASGNKTVFHYNANITPPRDYAKWATLIRKLVLHWVDRYGLPEVRQWFFEVWNEPNLKAFWTGTRADYFRLYRTTVRAIKGIDSRIQVGGPATANNQWIPEFLAYCSKYSVPADFVSTHHYPTDAFGNLGVDTVGELAHSYDGVMRKQVAKARSEAGNRPLFYTEWNTSSDPNDPLHDQSFAAAFATRIVMEGRGLAECYSFWTFSDIFEENYFSSTPFHGGFGLLSLHGIAKPVYRAFEMMHNLGNELLPLQGSHRTVSAWAVRDDRSLTVVLTNLAMPRHPITGQKVELHITGAPELRGIRIRKIDRTSANPAALWHRMGKPEYLNSSQVARLERASVPKELTGRWKQESDGYRCTVSLAPQSVAAVTWEFA